MLAAAGGTGVSAIELGKLMGARVIAAASSEDKRAAPRARPRRHHPLQHGGPDTEPALRGMASCGRYLVIGFAAGEIPKPLLNLALFKGCSVVSVFYSGFAQAEPARYEAFMQERVAGSRRAYPARDHGALSAGARRRGAAPGGGPQARARSC